MEGKTWFGLTADYAYGHDLLEVCRNYARKNGADLGQNELVPTDSTANFLGVGASTDDRVVVVGMREVIASRNGGKAWTRVPGQDIAVNWYSDTAHLDDGRRSLAVGHSGRIIAIDDVDTR